MCLSDLERGDSATVLGIQDENLRMHLLRFGITAGSMVQVNARLPFGPIVLKHAGLEVALGRAAAREVKVQFRSREKKDLKKDLTGTETRR